MGRFVKARFPREVVLDYKNRREQIENRRMERMLEELAKEYRSQEEKVREMQEGLEEWERGRLKNINVGGAKTLLHLPDEQEYLDARKALKWERDQLQVMKDILLADASGNGKKHAIKAVMIVHDEPVPAHSPVSPNLTLNLLLGTALGLLVSAGLSLLLIGILNRRPPTAGK